MNEEFKVLFIAFANEYCPISGTSTFCFKDSKTMIDRLGIWIKEKAGELKMNKLIGAILFLYDRNQDKQYFVVKEIQPTKDGGCTVLRPYAKSSDICIKVLKYEEGEIKNLL